MEGIIMMVIFAILGSIFSGKKKNEQKSMPPFNNKPTTTKAFDFPESDSREKRSSTSTKSLEDFANEVFSQLNQKNERSQKTIENRPNPVQSKVEQLKTVSQHATEGSRSVNRESRQVYKEINRNLSKDVIKEKEIGSFVPTSRESLVQAIIASEIIGPPKSKQR